MKPQMRPATATRHVSMPDETAPHAAAKGADAASATPNGTVEPRPRRQRTPVRRGPVKILFISANTRDSEPLDLSEEFRSIAKAIRAAPYHDSFQLIPELAARRSDLHDALLEHRPDVVHFACHGSAQAAILLRGDGPHSEPVSAESLQSLFGVLHDNLVLVVFNACFAHTQAAAIRKSAGLAIGMQAPVADRAAIRFASALYSALAHGRSVHEAFEIGKSAMDPPQNRVPTLFARPGLEPRTVALAGARSHRRRIVGVATAAGAALILVATIPRPSPPNARMVRFAAAEIRPGAFDAARRPPSCPAANASDDCTPVSFATTAPVSVAAFDLDILEVSNTDLANWLNDNPDLWTTDTWGRILTPSGVQLALTAKDCFSALAVTDRLRVVVAPDKARWPAVCVTWHGADAYCRAQHKRLPLAIEWNLAAARDGRPFAWGDALPRDDGVTFDRSGTASPHPSAVGGSPQDVSTERVYDLAGNVAEWVVDDRDLAESKTILGGSWHSAGPCSVLTTRCKRVPTDDYANDVGFRCARSARDEHEGSTP